jgi:hypothetical protein
VGVDDRGEGAVAWVWRAVHAAWSAPSPERAAEAGRRFRAALAPLTTFAEVEQTERRLHVGSTQLAQLERQVARLGVPTGPAGAWDPAEAEAPWDPVAAFPGPVDVALERLVDAPNGEVGARLSVGGLRVDVWGVWRLDGHTRLAAARAEATKEGVRFVAAGGTLALAGAVTVTTVAAPPPAPWGPRAWPRGDARLTALVDRVGARTRWDQALEGSRSQLALRGTSGAYDRGCLLRFDGVLAVRMAGSFSHAVVRLLRPEDVPATHVPAVPGWLAVGVDAEAGASDTQRWFVVCRGLGFEDEDAPAVSWALPVDPAVGDDAAAPYVVPAAVPDATAVGRAYAAFSARFETSGAAVPAQEALRSALRDAALRLADPPDDPFLPRAARLARRRRTADALQTAAAWADALDLPDAAAIAVEAAASQTEPPTPREREEATAQVAVEVVRRALGLPPRGVALDLDLQTVGRVLVDPRADAALPDGERAARAAALVVFSEAWAGPAALEMMLPDPADRARMAAAAPRVRAVRARLPPIADALARFGALDDVEVGWMLDRDEAAAEVYALLRVLAGR